MEAQNDTNEMDAHKKRKAKIFWTNLNTHSPHSRRHLWTYDPESQHIRIRKPYGFYRIDRTEYSSLSSCMFHTTNENQQENKTFWTKNKRAVAHAYIQTLFECWRNKYICMYRRGIKKNGIQTIQDVFHLKIVWHQKPFISFLNVIKKLTYFF